MRSKKIGTMEEFARAVGLSRPTVSKFFHDPASVRPKTRTRIEAVLKQSGFRPNIFAVNLNRRRTKIIGLIVPGSDRYILHDACPAHRNRGNGCWIPGIGVEFQWPPRGRSARDPDDHRAECRRRHHRPAGRRSRTTRKLKSLARETPLIFVDAPLDDEGPFVGTDNHQTIPLITEYLCRSGEPPTYLDMPKTNNNSRDRRDASRCHDGSARR